MDLFILTASLCQHHSGLSGYSLDMHVCAALCSAVGVVTSSGCLSYLVRFFCMLSNVHCGHGEGCIMVHGIHLPMYSDHDQALYKSNSIGTAMQ